MEQSSTFFYTNPWKSEKNDSSAFKQSSFPIPNDIPASIIKQHSVPDDSPAHFKQLSVPYKVPDNNS
jgi:hypothetical protein